MNFIRTPIQDVIICEPKVYGDNRGYFLEAYRRNNLEEFLGFPVNFIQDNESYSGYGTLRGLHYQLPPFAQTKLVHVIAGKVLDIVVDIRENSPTFGNHIAIELSGENKRQVLIPRGFAHGFVVLSKTALFAYKVDNYYNPEHDRGIAFNDPDLGINWQLDEKSFKLSPKDTKHPRLKDADLFEFGKNLYV